MAFWKKAAGWLSAKYPDRWLLGQKPTSEWVFGGKPPSGPSKTNPPIGLLGKVSQELFEKNNTQRLLGRK